MGRSSRFQLISLALWDWEDHIPSWGTPFLVQPVGGGALVCHVATFQGLGNRVTMPRAPCVFCGWKEGPAWHQQTGSPAVLPRGTALSPPRSASAVRQTGPDCQALIFA